MYRNEFMVGPFIIHFGILLNQLFCEMSVFIFNRKLTMLQWKPTFLEIAAKTQVIYYRILPGIFTNCGGFIFAD